MALSYIDTSALAKWYLPEAGSEDFSKWMQHQEDTCISSLTLTEFRCLLARRWRMVTRPKERTVDFPLWRTQEWRVLFPCGAWDPGHPKSFGIRIVSPDYVSKSPENLGILCFYCLNFFLCQFFKLFHPATF